MQPFTAGTCCAMSAGACNAGEADVNVLGTAGRDPGRFGIQLVAPLRDAVGLLLTGARSKSLEAAPQNTCDAPPAHKIVIAMRASAISGRPCIGHSEVWNGAGAFLPLDLCIPRCTPPPPTIPDGRLRLPGSFEERTRARRVPDPQQRRRGTDRDQASCIIF